MDHEKQEGQENYQKKPVIQLETAQMKSREPEKGKKQERAESTGWSPDLKLSDTIDLVTNIDQSNPNKFRKCNICGEPFSPSRQRIVYCSDQCKKTGHRLKAAEWQARNRYRRRAVTRRYYRKHREKILSKQKEYFRVNKDKISEKMKLERSITPIEERRIMERGLIAISEKPFMPYKEDEDAFILKNIGKFTPEEMARFLKRSIDSVRHRIKALKKS